MEITTLLYLTAGTVGLELLVFGVLLARKGLFRWAGAGFWAWAAFGLYYVVNPFFVALTGNNLDRYVIRLELSGGIPRGLWILLVIVLGIGVFFWAYLRQSAAQSSFKTMPLSGEATPLHLLGVLILIFFLAFGFYSLVQFRTFSAEQEVLITGGRFVGNVTGYQNNGYVFLFFPIAFFLLSSRGVLRLLGWGLAIAFLFLSLPHGWNRSTLVSMLLLLTLTTVLNRKQRWPKIIWIATAFALAAVLQMRGHEAWTYQEVPALVTESLEKSVQNASEVLAAQDTVMLSTFYLESYVRDSITGYQYGLPLLNYILTGWIPYRFLPQKYFIIDWLQMRQPEIPLLIEQWLFGAKSTLFGDLYGNGWLLGIILGAWGLAYLHRKIDAGIQSPNLIIRAASAAVLAQMWLVWGSSAAWGLVRVGFILVPAGALWLTNRWAERYQKQQLPYPDIYLKSE